MVGRNGTDRPQPLARSRSVHFTLCFCLRTFVVSSVRTVLFCLSGVSARRCEPWLLLPQRDLRDHALRVVRIRPDGHEDWSQYLGWLLPIPSARTGVGGSEPGRSVLRWSRLRRVLPAPARDSHDRPLFCGNNGAQVRRTLRARPVVPLCASVGSVCCFLPSGQVLLLRPRRVQFRPLPVVRTVPCTVRFLSQCLHSRWLLRAFCW